MREEFHAIRIAGVARIYARRTLVCDHDDPWHCTDLAPPVPTLAAPLPQGEGAPDATLERHNVVLTEYAFEPSEVVAAAGLIPLRIVNGGIRRHTMVVLIDGVEVASPEVRPGDTVDWDITIERPGRYLYWCGEYRHLEKGMAGTLIAP